MTGDLVEIDDTRLFVEARGAGYPIIVLHGGPGLDHHEFADYLDPLTEGGFRLLLVDQRAQGRSDRAPEHTWTLERMAQDVIMLARALELPRHAVLGYSYGALVALQSAVDFPGATAQTVVSGGVPSMKYLDAVERNLAAFEPVELRQQVTDSWAREQFVQTQDEFAELMRDQFPFHFADPEDPRIADYIDRTKDTVYAPDVLRVFAAAGYGGIEVEDRLGEVTAPMLVCSGRYDRTCIVEAGVAIANRVTNCELVVFENSGHMMFVEEQAAYLSAVREFLERHI